MGILHCTKEPFPSLLCALHTDLIEGHRSCINVIGRLLSFFSDWSLTCLIPDIPIYLYQRRLMIYGGGEKPSHPHRQSCDPYEVLYLWTGTEHSTVAKKLFNFFFSVVRSQCSIHLHCTILAEALRGLCQPMCLRKYYEGTSALSRVHRHELQS